MRTTRLLPASPSMHCTRGVSAPGGYLPLVHGGCLLLGGVCSGRCLLMGIYLPLVWGIPASGPKGVPASGLGVWGGLAREGVGHLPGGTCPEGVPAWGCTCPGGICLGVVPAQGVSAWWGVCLGVSAWGVSAQGGVCHVIYPIMHLMLPVCCLHTN